MAKKQTAVRKSSIRRDAMLKPKWTKPLPLSEKQRTVILALVGEGATLSEVFTIRGVASYGAFYAARIADPEFDSAVRQALAQGAEAAIAEATELSREAVEQGDAEKMRIAEMFHRCALAYAEKAAPREYGQLIKLGSHDGGALSVSVINYAVPALSGELGKDRQITDISRVAYTDVDFDELDAPSPSQAS